MWATMVLELPVHSTDDDTETGCEVFGAGLEDVIDVASSMANRAGYVAAFAMPT